MKVYKIRGCDSLDKWDFDYLKREHPNADVLVYNYTDGGYDGSGFALWRDGDKFGYAYLGHCSCNGPLEDCRSILYTFDKIELLQQKHEKDYDWDMATLIMTKGLPASGKTTWAKKCLAESNRVKRVNKDDLRAMIDAGKWSKSNEKFVLSVRDYITRYALLGGFDCIVDDTNLAPKHESTLRAIAEDVGAQFEIKDFTDVPLNECLKRNAERANFVPEETIKSMYNSFIRKKGHVAQYQAPPYNEDLPNCIIVDIDGTLAHITDRSPYDYTQVHTDVVDETVANVVRRYAASRDIMEEIPDTYIVIVSGRDDTCKSETIEWLRKNQIPFDEIFMRDVNRVDEKGNKIDDRIIKREIYEKYIQPRYNVRFVLDDRDRVVQMWREQGLKVLQVAEGNF